MATMNKILLAPFLLFTMAAPAQVKHKPVATKPATQKPAASTIKKFIPPRVKTYLAKFTGSNAVCSAEEGKQIITLPLRVTDSKDFSYKISFR